MESEGTFKRMKKYPIVKNRGVLPTIEMANKVEEKRCNGTAQSWHSEGDSLNNKRKSLKYCHTKYKKFEKGYTSSSHNIKNRKWPWCSHIQLLNDSLTRLKNRSCVSCHGQTAGPCDPPTHDGVKQPLPLETSKHLKRRRFSEEEIYNADSITNYFDTKKGPDDIDHLFMSYAATFRRISPRLQAKLKIDLANLFASAELEDMNS
ncbi:unnamed protein product [Nezara viridula]|uniref:Cytochrome c domain-containing protein n=1 Tax=Nezara viridula TaxID=85310 RepID=A0A9P0HF69_NEZVI|nr:unnamed protein product [Nezara viridula]